MEFTELSKLACDRGCRLNVVLVGGVPIYWVENSHFIGRPFRKLDELTRFLRQMPLILTSENEFLEPQGQAADLMA
jgi:hypothetical protein